MICTTYDIYKTSRVNMYAYMVVLSLAIFLIECHSYIVTSTSKVLLVFKCITVRGGQSACKCIKFEHCSRHALRDQFLLFVNNKAHEIALNDDRHKLKLTKKEAEKNEIRVDNKEKLEMYTKRKLANFQEKYFVALQEC